INTTAISGTSDRPVLVRDAANSAWIPVGLAHYDGTGQLRGFLTMSDGAILLEKLDSGGSAKSFALFGESSLGIHCPSGQVLLHGSPVTVNGELQIGPASASGDAAQIDGISPIFAITSGSLPTVT